jgi:hypothetical protein
MVVVVVVGVALLLRQIQCDLIPQSTQIGIGCAAADAAAVSCLHTNGSLGIRFKIKTEYGVEMSV